MSVQDRVTADELLEFATPVADGTDPEKAAQHALIAAEGVIEAYTRGRHARAGAYRPGVRSVVLTAAARILANPGQVSVRVTSGAVTVSKGAGWQGFTLGEQQVLNRYRKRAI